MLLCGELRPGAIDSLLGRYGLRATRVSQAAVIPGSYWGEPEAGLIGDRVFFRDDTPVHSLLHETSHYICATPGRRLTLLRDAGGDDAEEAAVCYLQVLLWQTLTGRPRALLFRDMDAWGYSFRLGGAGRWFEEDAEDALAWLRRAGLVDGRRVRLGALRGASEEKSFDSVT